MGSVNQFLKGCGCQIRIRNVLPTQDKAKKNKDEYRTKKKNPQAVSPIPHINGVNVLRRHGCNLLAILISLRLQGSWTQYNPH